MPHSEWEYHCRQERNRVRVLTDASVPRRDVLERALHRIGVCKHKHWNPEGHDRDRTSEDAVAEQLETAAPAPADRRSHADEKDGDRCCPLGR